MPKIAWAGGLLAALLMPMAEARVAWDENVNGDLSGIGTAPSVISLSPGSNQIVGATGDRGAGVDIDDFTLTIPTGWQLSSLELLPITAPESAAFLGIQAGSRMTATTASGLLGWMHYAAFDTGQNLLPRIASNFGAIGFTVPLKAGTYSFWIQDYDPGPSPYGIDLSITAVPEPASTLTLLSGLAALAAFRRRRQAPASGVLQHALQHTILDRRKRRVAA
jgi:hypothetical protein